MSPDHLDEHPRANFGDDSDTVTYEVVPDEVTDFHSALHGLDGTTPGVTEGFSTARENNR